jgi:hypothetical protein
MDHLLLDNLTQASWWIKEGRWLALGSRTNRR